MACRMLDLRNDICRLRALEPSDLELLYLWENDPEIWRVSGTIAPISRERLQQFIAEQSYDLYATREMRLIIESDGIAIGTLDILDFDPHHRRFGIGILIYDTTYRRHGYAHSAITLIKEYAHNTLGLKQIWASVAADNDASIALFESCGFERCGYRRAWQRRGTEYIDEVEFQALLIR